LTADRKLKFPSCWDGFSDKSSCSRSATTTYSLAVDRKPKLSNERRILNSLACHSVIAALICSGLSFWLWIMYRFAGEHFCQFLAFLAQFSLKS